MRRCRPASRTTAAALRSFLSVLVIVALLVGLSGLVRTAEAAAQPTVCFLSCDTLDPSRAGQETFPVPEKNINGRRLVLHVSDADGMAWGSIDDGATGDAVWLDRSWDGGHTWDGLLGKAGIPSTWTGTRTLTSDGRKDKAAGCRSPRRDRPDPVRVRPRHRQRDRR